jgi:2-polyprenyl-3-methyl-5-hydroxy-6-metoxy-1,4-benzoquinol methylase
MGDRSKPELEARVIALVERNSTVIDLGCGAGELIARLHEEKGAVCTGADFSGTALAKLEARGFRTLHATLPKVPSPDACFEVAVCLETLEHVDDYVGVISEMNRITKEGGLLVVSTPDGTLWGAGGEHVHAFSAADLVSLLRPHVHVVNVVWLLGGGYPHLLAWGFKDSSSRVLFDGRNLQADPNELK